MRVDIWPSSEHSQELFKVAIQTMPVTPVHGEVTLLADDLDYPGDGFYRNEYSTQEYLEECAKKGILPHTKIQELVSPYGTSIRELNIGSCNIVGTPLEQVISGRVHKVHIVGSLSGWSEEYFEQFRNITLPKLLEQGYQIRDGQFWLNSYGAGDQGKSGILFDKRTDPIGAWAYLPAEYIFRQYLMGPEIWHQKLQSWMEDLRNKYHKTPETVSNL